MAIAILLFSAAALLAGYFYYGKFIERRLGVDPARVTPSHTMHDGVDYNPASRSVLFGHHLTSMLGATVFFGPAVAIFFGWAPVIIWILFAGIFIGGAHDFSVLIASVRNGGKSIGSLMGSTAGRISRQLFLLIIWCVLVLLIGVFISMLVESFTALPSIGSAAILFTALAVFFGMTVYKWRAPVWLATIICLIFLGLFIALGWFYPFMASAKTWIIALAIYIFIASIIPVWALPQPRGYLNSYLLYIILLFGVVGIFADNPAVNVPAFAGFYNPEFGYLWPAFFVIVAWGAISGFHSVIASGMTAKQIDSEKDARRIGYGAMMVESLVAVIATILAASLFSADYLAELNAGGPTIIFVRGIGKVSSALGLPQKGVEGFSALVVSSLVLTSLDTATRLARFAFQEFFAPAKEKQPPILNRNRYIGGAVTAVAGGLLAWSGDWGVIWPVFATAIQLIAAFALIAVSLWLIKGGQKAKFILIPAAVMFVIAISALGFFTYGHFMQGKWLLFSIGVALILFTTPILYKAIESIIKRQRGGIFFNSPPL